MEKIPEDTNKGECMNGNINKIKFLIPILELTLLIMLFNCNYAIVDDAMINYFTQGLCGIGYNQIAIPYVGIIVTGLVYVIQLIVPMINGYLCYLLLSIAIIFSVLDYLLYKRQAVWIEHIIMYIFEAIVFFQLTYTVVAYLWCFMGILLYSEKFGIDRRKKLVLIPICAEIFGISTRTDVWFTSMILCFPFAVYEWKEKNNSNQLKMILLSFILFISIKGVNQFVYHYSEVEKDYIEWNQASTEIRDYEAIPYSEYEEDYKELSLSENDVAFLQTWMFADKERFDIDTLKSIAQLRSVSKTYELNPLKIFSAAVKNRTYVFIFMLAILLGIFRKNNIYALGEIGVTALMLVGLIIRKRVVMRVIIPVVLICAIVFLIYKLDFGKRRIIKFKNFMAFVIVILCLLELKKENILQINSTYVGKEELNNYITNNKDRMFVFSSFPALYQTQGNICKLSVDKNDYLNNIICLGDWGTFSNQYYSVLEKNGVQERDNIFKALLEENVYLICDNDETIKRLENYYTEYYKGKVNVQYIATIDAENIYEIRR